MKKIAIILCFVIASGFTFISLLPENSLEDITKNVTNAIRKGSASELAVYFNSSIDLTVPDKEGSFSKAQAEQIVKDFFTKNTPKSFEIKHQGKSADGSNYAIGTLVTNTGNFRTYFLIKSIANKSCIQQLQFDNDK
ncbi:MAG: DUF4783 domain-containing protein [Bacteroidetes bacterium]|nr:DUF4783 domain-containing protein [Bacteroidota bacterium]